MVAKQEIEFVIKPNGDVEFTVKGVKGTGCEGLAKLFDDLGKKTSDRHTAEYYEKEGSAGIRARRR